MESLYSTVVVDQTYINTLLHKSQVIWGVSTDVALLKTRLSHDYISVDDIGHVTHSTLNLFRLQNVFSVNVLHNFGLQPIIFWPVQTTNSCRFSSDMERAGGA